MSCRCRAEGQPLQEARQRRRGLMERRHYLFGSGSAGGVLFSANRKRTPDLLPSQHRSASLRSARSLRSLAPSPGKCPLRVRDGRRGGGSPPPPHPLGRVARCAPRRAIACGVERPPTAPIYPLKSDVEGVPLKPHPLNAPPPYRDTFGLCYIFRIVFMCSSARRTET